MTGNRPNKVKQELNRNTHVTERPLPVGASRAVTVLPGRGGGCPGGQCRAGYWGGLQGGSGDSGGHGGSGDSGGHGGAGDSGGHGGGWRPDGHGGAGSLDGHGGLGSLDGHGG